MSFATGVEAGLMGRSMAGKAVAAAGGYFQGYMQSLGYKREGWQADQAAKEIENQFGYESWRRDLATQRTLGTQRAGYAAAGVDLSGSAIDNLAESAKMMTLDKMMAGRAATIAATQQRDDARFYRASAKAAKQAGTLNAIASFLG